MIQEHDSILEKVLKKGFWLYLFSFIIAPLSYIIRIIISGDLNVEEVGLLYGIIGFMVLFSSFNDLGIGSSFTKFIPQYLKNKEFDKIKSLLFIGSFTQIIIGFFLFLLFFYGSDFLGKNYFNNINSIIIIKVFSLYFLGNTMFNIIANFFQSIQDTFYQKFIEFLKILFTFIFTIIIFFYDYGNILNYSIIWIIGLYITIGIGLLIFYKKYYKKHLKGLKISIVKKDIIEIYKFSIIIFLGSQISTILTQIDLQMITFFLGNKEAGYYTNYLSMIGIPMTIIGPIILFLFPMFSELISKDKLNEIIKIKNIFNKEFFSFCIMISLFIFYFSNIITNILFGIKFNTSGIILQYSILFIVFYFLIQVNFSILTVLGQIKDRFNIMLFGLLFNIIGNLLFIKLYGSIGVAIITGLTWFVIYLLTEIKLKHISNYFFKHILINFIIFLIFGYLIQSYFTNLFSNDKIYNLLILILLFTTNLLIYFFINYKNLKLLLKSIKNIGQK